MTMKKFLFLTLILFSGMLYAQNWVNEGTGLPFHFANSFNEAIVSGGDMYVVGYTYDGISTYTPGVYRNTGGTWTQLGSGFPSAASVDYNIYAIAEFGGDIFIGGNFTMNNGTDPEFYDVAKWDEVNSRWVPVGDGSGDGSVNELTIYDNKLYAGGDFGDLGAAGSNNIAVYDGVSWSAVGTGLSTASPGGEDPDQVKSMVVYDSKLYVGGKFSTAGGDLVHNIAYWNGTDWNYLTGNDIEGGGGVGDGTSGNVAIMAMQVFGSDLYIGGMFSTYYNGTYLGSATSISGHLVKWNGSSFSAPSVSVSTPTNNRINAMTVYNNRIYIGNENENEIYSWDGGLFAWRLEPDRDPIRQTVHSFYSNGSDIYYIENYGVFRLNDPLASFYVSDTKPCEGEEITFTDTSTGTNIITSWNWTFPGGTPASSTEQNPIVIYDTKGDYDVTLEVTTSDGSNSITKTNYITMNDDITITQQPTDLVQCSSVNSADFSVGVTYTGDAVSYQWQVLPVGSDWTDLVDGGPVFGATSSSLSYSVTPDMNGFKFRCVVSKCSNSVTSNEATLTLTPAPVISEETDDTASCVSGDGIFSVVATGEGTLSYQWQYADNLGMWYDLADGTNYSGSSTSTLAVTGIDNTTPELFDDNETYGVLARYQCVITSSNGCSETSNYIDFYVHEAPTISEEPADVSLCDVGSGVNTSFSVTPSFTVKGLNYQWQEDDGSGGGFVDIADDDLYSGSTTSVLSLTGATSELSGNQYRCNVGDCPTAVYSYAAILTIDEMEITSQPVEMSVCDGSDATFTVEATASDVITYQWQERQYNNGSFGSWQDITDTTPFSGTATATLTITTPGTDYDNHLYRCVITAGTCSQNSSQASLQVYSQPTLTLFGGNMSDICEGTSTTFKVNPSDLTGFTAEVFTYQWQVDLLGDGTFTDIIEDVVYSNSTTSELSITEAPLNMDGLMFRCVIKGCTSENVSAIETLAVSQLPAITTEPESIVTCPGETVTFTAAATGTNVTYQWFVDAGGGYQAATQAGNTDPDYSFVASQNYDGYKYKVEASSGNCDVVATSLEATLSVPSITTHPVSVEICPNGDATFTIEAAGSGFTYEWLEDGVTISEGGVYSGTDTNTLTITGATFDMNGKTYQGVLNTGSCFVASSAAQLLVTFVQAPVISADFSNPQSPILSAQVSGDSFDWFLDGTAYTAGGNESTITIDQAGSYTAIANVSGCASEESDPFTVVITGFESSFNNTGVSLYPNPVQSELILEIATSVKVESGVQVVLTGLDGKTMYNRNFTSLPDRKVEIDMSRFDRGIYLVQVLNEGKVSQYKIQKQ